MSADIPDYCEPVIGWRMWNTTGDPVAGTTHLASAMSTVWPHHTKLTAIHLDSIWRYVPGQQTRALWHESPCESPCRRSPGCGIYCFKSDEMLLTQVRINGPRPVIVGRVALWGRVAEHQWGYRGQFAYPVSLHYAFNLSTPDAVALAASYGIPYEEQPVWTSAQSKDASWQSRLASQFHTAYYLNPPLNAPMGIIPHAWAPIHPAPRPPECPKSKNPLECEQPTFNRGKPIHWIWRRSAWTRSDDNE